MPPLEMLPTEIIHLICDHLNPFERQVIACSGNSRLYAIVRPRYDPEWVLNASRMSMRFMWMMPRINFWPKRAGVMLTVATWPGRICPAAWDQVCDVVSQQPWAEGRVAPLLEKLGLPAPYDGYCRRSPPDVNSVVKLDGSLQWLTGGNRLADHVPLGTVPDFFGSDPRVARALNWAHLDAAPLGRHRKMLEQVQSLGFEVPAALLNFYTSGNLPPVWIMGEEVSFRLGRLFKCPINFDGGAGGYLLDVAHMFGRTRVMLYMAPGGAHAVILETRDGSNANQDADHDWLPEGIPEFQLCENTRFSLQAFTFEEWLLQYCFEREILAIMCCNDDAFPTLPDDLLRYAQVCFAVPDADEMTYVVPTGAV